MNGKWYSRYWLVNQVSVALIVLLQGCMCGIYPHKFTNEDGDVVQGERIESLAQGPRLDPHTAEK